MSKVYEYDDNVYCEDDVSSQYSNYAGDLYDMYYAMKKNYHAYEHTFYYVQDGDVDGRVYDSYEEMIENECEDCVIADTEGSVENV